MIKPSRPTGRTQRILRRCRAGLGRGSAARSACSRSRLSADPAPREAGYACTSSTAALCHPTSALGPRLEVPVQASHSKARTASRGRPEARAPANRRHSSSAAIAAAARWSDLPADDPLPWCAAHGLLNARWSRPLHANPSDAVARNDLYGRASAPCRQACDGCEQHADVALVVGRKACCERRLAHQARQAACICIAPIRPKVRLHERLHAACLCQVTRRHASKQHLHWVNVLSTTHAWLAWPRR